MTEFTQNTETLYVDCPHCNASIEVRPNELNCTIFRHGVFMDTLEQLDPHATKEFCDSVVARKMIYGCGNPFRIIENSNGVFIAIKCDYI